MESRQLFQDWTKRQVKLNI